MARTRRQARKQTFADARAKRATNRLKLGFKAMKDFVGKSKKNLRGLNPTPKTTSAYFDPIMGLQITKEGNIAERFRQQVLADPKAISKSKREFFTRACNGTSSGSKLRKQIRREYPEIFTDHPSCKEGSYRVCSYQAKKGPKPRKGRQDLRESKLVKEHCRTRPAGRRIT